MFNPPVLTNLPFLPPLDLGKECRGEKKKMMNEMHGVCYTRAKCEGLGLAVIGDCSKDKSLCCSGKTRLELDTKYYFVFILRNILL